MNPKPVLCPECGNEFEHITELNVNGILMLKVGIVVIPEAVVVCLNCGRISYWSFSKKVVTGMIKSALSNL
jgi:uncharacterized protein with PIN domain